LKIATVMAKEKTLTRTTAVHMESGEEVRGYEIHHGVTDGEGVEPILKLTDGRFVGARSSDGLMWGAYVHGIFDSDGFRRWFLDRLRVRRGLAPIGRISAIYDPEPALERLAEVVRRSIDVDRIYGLMGL
jgi:cobyric acid synthase